MNRNAEILRREKAYPQMTIYRNNLYVIRNSCTTDSIDADYPSLSCSDANAQPQLWKYDGTNWTRMAQDGSNITNMGNPNKKHITMIIRNGGTYSTGGYLYLGFDNNADGLEIWRTDVDDPDLSGKWTQVGGAGLAGGNTHIYDSHSLNFSGIDYLYLSCGDISNPVKIYRTRN